MELLVHLFAFLLGHDLLKGSLTCSAFPLSQYLISTQQRISFVHDSQRFSPPVSDVYWADRHKEIRSNREGYLYGPPLLGNTSYFPTGVLGDARVLQDKELWFRDVQYLTDDVYEEIPLAAKALQMVSAFLKNFSVYH